MNNSIRIGLLAAMLCALAACGNKDDAALTTYTQKVTPAAKPAVRKPVTPDDPTASMAVAVMMSKVANPAMTLKYEWAGKPIVGSATDLKLALLASADVASGEANVSGMSNVDITANAKHGFRSIKKDDAEYFVVPVKAHQPGIYYVTINVSAQTAEGAQAMSYAIPFLASNAPEPKQEPPTPANAPAKK